MRGVPRWIYALLALLFGMMVIQTANPTRSNLLPTVSNHQADGLTGLADILRDQGYRVSASSHNLNAIKADLVIRLDDNGETVAKNVSSLVLHASGDLPKDWKPAQLPVRTEKRKYSLAVPAWEMTSVFVFEKGVVLARYQSGSVATLVPKKNHLTVHLGPGWIALNEYVKQGDNAKFLGYLVTPLVPPGGHIVFYTPPTDGSFLARLHPAAPSIWKQAILLGVIIIFTLGLRFGTPVVERIPQRGVGNLLLAFGNVMARGKRDHLAAALFERQINEQIRQALNLPADATLEQRNSYLEPDEVETLRRLNLGTQSIQSPVPLEILRKALAIPQRLRRR